MLLQGLQSLRIEVVALLERLAGLLNSSKEKKVFFINNLDQVRRYDDDGITFQIDILPTTHQMVRLLSLCFCCVIGRIGLLFGLSYLLD